MLPGLDRIAAEGAGDLVGRRVGLITNHTGRTIAGRAAAPVLLDAGVDVRVLFGPEHGVGGSAAAGEAIADARDPETGLPTLSLYGATREPDPAVLAGLDALVFDVQDIGVRFYTYISTLRLALAAADAAGLEFWVLDRPNPNGGARIEGPMLDPEFLSFVGTDRLPLLHGMTVGELARLFAARHGGEVRVKRVSGWRRDARWEDTGLPWRAPSPNIPRLESALAYPALGLFEGVSLSEGRGTDEPFQLVGAPTLDPEAWLAALGGPAAIRGLTLTPARFTPRPVPAAPSPRFAGEAIDGLRVAVTEPEALRPVRAGLALIAAARAARPGAVAFRPAGDGYWLDLLLGTDRIRLALEAGEAPGEVMDREAPAVRRFAEERRPYLLYPPGVTDPGAAGRSPAATGPPRFREAAVAAALFAATALTTLWAGGALALASLGGDLSGPAGGSQSALEHILLRLRLGAPYSFALLAILLSHEMGHAITARRWRIDASLPYFLPMPLNLVGTLGAFIRIRSPFPNRTALLDVGLAGPFAGFLVCLPVLAVGLAGSRVGAPESAGILFGEPLLFRLFAAIFGPSAPEGSVLYLSPLGLAGWFGLLLTAINLLPMGQLDGGHALYALARGRALRISRAVHGSMFVLALWSPSWLIWALLCWLLRARRRHPPTLADEAPLARGRVAVALLALLVFALCFTPAPIVLSWRDLFS